MPRNKLLQIRRGTFSEWFDANPELKSGELGLDTSNNRLKIGQGNWNDLDYISLNETLIQIKNVDDSVIRKGQGVYIFNEDFGIAECKRYLANANNPKHQFIGLATTDIGVNKLSYAMYFGKLVNINTTGSSVGDLSIGDEVWNFGDKLYVSSLEPGKLTKTPHTHGFPIGFVLVVDEVNGYILVNPSSSSLSSTLNDLQDVTLNNTNNGELLRYDSNSSLWKNDGFLDGGSY